MSAPLIALILLVAALCLFILWRIRRVHRRQAYYVSRVRASDMYGHLYPLLLRCSRRSVESIAIRPESVCIRLYNPAGRTLLYTFDKHGFDPLEPDTLLALALAGYLFYLDVCHYRAKGKANKNKEANNN